MGTPGKNAQRQEMLGKTLSPGFANQLGDLGEVIFSIRGSNPHSGKWMTAQAKVKDQGAAFPGPAVVRPNWEAGTCNSPFPFENPQPATSLQSENPSDAPVLQQHFQAFS